MSDDLKRQLGFWIEGQSMEKYRECAPETREFNGNAFLEEISRKRKHEVDSVDDKKLSDTDKAFHLAFNPGRKHQYDGDKEEQMQQEQQEPPLGRQVAAIR